VSALEASPFAARDGRLRRRKLASRAMEALGALGALLALGVLGVLFVAVFVRGAGALGSDLFTLPTHIAGAAFGSSGVANAIVGTVVIVALATAIAVPVGVLTAIYVSEFARRSVAQQIRLWLDVLNGFPSIVIGIFVFALCVKVELPLLGIGRHQSALAGGFALSIIMLPLVARSTMEVLRLVPNHLREASYALGVSKWQTVLRVVLPTSLGGILTGTTLAIARAAGETAPLLFTCAIAGTLVDWNPAHSMLSIPLTIFEYSESPDEGLHAQAWAAAFVLIVFILATSLTARFLLDRSRRKLGPAR
jgi:phosphate transport system permease protein